MGSSWAQTWMRCLIVVVRLTLMAISLNSCLEAPSGAQTLQHTVHTATLVACCVVLMSMSFFHLNALLCCGHWTGILSGIHTVLLTSAGGSGGQPAVDHLELAATSWRYWKFVALSKSVWCAIAGLEYLWFVVLISSRSGVVGRWGCGRGKGMGGLWEEGR